MGKSIMEIGGIGKLVFYKNLWIFFYCCIKSYLVKKFNNI